MGLASLSNVARFRDRPGRVRLRQTEANFADTCGRCSFADGSGLTILDGIIHARHKHHVVISVLVADARLVLVADANAPPLQLARPATEAPRRSPNI
jgi:hypothetical protein